MEYIVLSVFVSLVFNELYVFLGVGLKIGFEKGGYLVEFVCIYILVVFYDFLFLVIVFSYIFRYFLSLVFGFYI